MRLRVHRIGKRCRKSLKGEIASTFADPARVDEGLAVLLGAFS